MVHCSIKSLCSGFCSLILRRNKIDLWILLCFFYGVFSGFAQVNIEAEAFVSPSSRTISVKQKVSYFNASQDTLAEFYLNDWNHAFSSKNSPLAKHFSSSYLRKYHFSNLSQRGETRIDYIRCNDLQNADWVRAEKQPDLIKIVLEKKLLPGENLQLDLKYTLRLPEKWLTGYGIDEWGNFNLKNWLIAPAVYDGKWILYSHQNIDDHYAPLSQLKVILKLPSEYQVVSGMQQKKLPSSHYVNEIELSARHYNDFSLVVTQLQDFEEFRYGKLKLFSNIIEDDLPDEVKQVTVKRILSFLEEKLDAYPHQNLMVTQTDYQRNPVYGLTQLPDFIRPFSDHFQYDLKMLKTITINYLNTSMQFDRRKEEWLLNAITVYLMMEYIDTYYPEEKMIGKLSDFFGLKWTHLAEVDFNSRYDLFFMNMNRINLDQPLSQSKDSLVKFNQEIANPFKAGIGFSYLNEFLATGILDATIKEFYQTQQLKSAHSRNFERILKNKSEKNVDWFFEDFIHTNKRLDFTIKKIHKEKDSLKVVIRNKEDHSMPVSVYGINDKTKEILYETWVENTKGISSVRIPKKNVSRVALNYDGIIPEINKRNNQKTIGKPLNRPLQFRLFTDLEDPDYAQIFLMPEFSYNYYDGFILGTKILNQALLPKKFVYHLTPQYGFKSRDIIGRITLTYNQQFRNQNLSDIYYGFIGQRYHYGPDVFYHRMSPYVVFNWRHRDLRNKERQSLTIRNVYLHRDDSEFIDFEDNPNYNVLNFRYNYSNRSLIDSYSSFIDYQLGKKFSKLSIMGKYRKLFLNNQQIEFRFFAGKFLYNKTDTDYFSFGLDRPTDYLFDYNYYGRSESSGLFSQQFIESEGGFKSRLNPHFANDWLTAFNTSVSFYRDVAYVYGDLAVIKNRGESIKMRYDSGFRLSLVQDYFEVFFPVYSNNGWEIAQPHYDQKIRFIVSLDVKTLMGLFRRTYY